MSANLDNVGLREFNSRKNVSVTNLKMDYLAKADYWKWLNVQMANILKFVPTQLLLCNQLNFCQVYTWWVYQVKNALSKRSSTTPGKRCKHYCTSFRIKCKHIKGWGSSCCQPHQTICLEMFYLKWRRLMARWEWVWLSLSLQNFIDIF